MKVPALLGSLLCATALLAEPASDSLYRIDALLTDQAERAVRLDAAAKGPALVSMFYASCPHTCPILITSLQLLERQLTPEERNGLRVLLVSFDPERDTPAKLAELAREHHVDISRWTLAQPRANDVRLLAAALDVRYRKLPDGEFNHSVVITLLDRDGRPAARTSKLGEPDPEFLAALRASLRQPAEPHPDRNP